jgi:hypothetical protein
MNLKKMSALAVLVSLLATQIPAYATVEDDRQIEMQALLLRMAQVSPHGTMDASLSRPEDRAALEQVKSKLTKVDYLLEDADDAYTVGDFEKATAILLEIQKDPGLTNEQRSRAETYAQAMEKERSTRMMEQTGKPNKPVIQRLPREVLKKDNTWNDVLTYGGITLGVAAVGVGVYLLTK